MRKHILIGWAAIICLLSGCAGPAGAKKDIVADADGAAPLNKPNVIIVLTDDQGYGDLSCHGNPVLQTPNIDKFFNESIRLGDFHVSPLCTPTRGQLMTGLDAMHNRAATVGRGLALMRRDVVTMPEIFRANGYRTGIFGKWHLGDSYPDRPMDRGFEKAVWIKGWGLLSETEFDNDYYKTRYLDSLETKYSDKYCTDLWFDQAMEWMSDMRARGQPFFTYLALNAPHGPFDALEEDEAIFRDKVDAKTASFYGMIRNIDRNMARLEEWLVKHNLRENTLVIFMTDNGSAVGAPVYNAGMRGEKGSNYDGGHRVPCFIRWPNGKLGNPRTEHAATQVQDILPTLIDLLGFKMEKNYHFDGVSLSPILKQEGGALPDRMFVVQYAGLDELQQKYFSAVIWNSWRLVGGNELYDVGSDPGQTNNVADAHPEVFEKMKAFYDVWWEGVTPWIGKYVPVVVGSSENPVILSSDSWISGSINTQWKVALVEGAPNGGEWPIDVTAEGEYKVQLSRWPFHLNRPLTAKGPAQAVGGRKINPGKAVPVASGCVSLNNGMPTVTKAVQNAADVTMHLTLPRGEHRLRAWFRDETGRDVCGAYYLRMERVDNANARE